MKKIFILTLFAISSLHLNASSDAKNSKEDVKTLYQNAERSMMIKDFASARQAYLNLLQSTSPSSVDIFYYADVCIRLSFAEKELGLLEEAEKRLQRLLFKPLPDDLYLRAKLLLAKIFQAQHKEENAYFLLIQLQSQLPFEKWQPEDRGYFVMLQGSLTEQYQLLLCQATRLYEAAMYQESTILLQELMQKVEAGKYPNHATDSLKILKLLVKAHFHNKNFSKIITLLQPKKEALLVQNEEETLIYLARSYKEIGSLMQAQELYEQLQNKNDTLDFYLSLEKGQTEFLVGNYLKAKTTLSKVLNDCENIDQKILAKLLLAKIYLKEMDYKEVKSLLEKDTEFFLKTDISHANPSIVKYEMAYLLAESYFATSDFERAAFFFEKSIPSLNEEKAAWTKYANLKKGSCFLKLAEKEEVFLEQAIATFKLLKEDEKIKEQALIGLAWAFVLKNDTHTLESLNELESLIEDTNNFYSLETKAEIELVKIKCEKDPIKKLSLYKTLCESSPLSTTLAGKKAWFFKGEKMLELAKSSTITSEYPDKTLLKQSIDNFDKSYELLKNLEPEIAALSLYNKAYCLHLLKDTQNLKICSNTLETLIFNKQFEACPKKIEALYLFINTLSSQSDFEDDAVVKKADKALEMLQELTIDSTYLELSLFNVAKLCYEAELFSKAEELFYKTYQLFPQSKQANECLFFAALCNERSEEEKEIKANFFRRLILKNDPQSPFAEEAYLRLYTFSEYVQGENNALIHLKEMPNLYPQSKHLPIAYFLLGLQAKEKMSVCKEAQNLQDYQVQAFSYFLKVISSFEELANSEPIENAKQEDLKNVYFRSLIDYASLALETMDKSALETSIYQLNRIKDLYFTCENTLTKELKERYAYPPLLEEIDYLLSKTLLANFQSEMAQKTLEDLVKKYGDLNIKKSYWLTLAYYELGRIESKKQCHEKALTYFKLADESSYNNLISGEEKLKIWMESSNSLRALGRFDEAMLYLSFVINENISSSTRIEAMLLRSELYQLQGRHELAIKQLEAVSKNGGEFAFQAKDKLKEHYGFE